MGFFMKMGAGIKIVGFRCNRDKKKSSKRISVRNEDFEPIIKHISLR